MPEGVELADKLDGAFDFVHLFITNTEELNRLAPVAIGAVKRDGVLWISYPKGSSKVKTDIGRDKGWDVVQSAGFEGVSLVSIDGVWSAMCFRPGDPVNKGKIEECRKEYGWPFVAAT